MRAILQRVSSASVRVDRELVGEIDKGILVLLGVEKGDTSTELEKLLNKLVNYRIFNDQNGHMNLSVTDVQGELLIVSQFTVAADTKKGLRPSFSSAASPDIAEVLYEEFVERARKLCKRVAVGRFGADMKVTLTNDGPVTFLLTT
ncbi:MAG: D-aminoacyl-tRNA deacylase [Pseudomonadales bacterium]|nr:D-aminoacyl-tRNA deacylase [Pseudomonadales bacterium]